MKQTLPIPFSRPRFLLPLLLIVLASCSKEKETVNLVSLDEYYPTEVGRTITYRLDSTVYVGLNGDLEIHSYQVMDEVEAQVLDAEGRTAYRIRRMIRDTAGLEPWRDNETFLVTPRDNRIEMTENNLRFIKLAQPLREGYSWKGNNYLIPGGTPGNIFAFYQDWDYEYYNVGQPYNENGLNIDTAVVVKQVEELDPPTIRYSMEVYAKGIGLVFKDLLNEATEQDVRTGFGVRLVMIDHN